MSFDQLLQYIFIGISSGSIYALIAIGYNVIYNTTGIINFAQGEFLMLGGMISISMLNYFPLPIAILIAVVITALVGLFIDFAIIRRVKEVSVVNMVIITIGLSILIREVALHIWGEAPRKLPFFTGTDSSTINVFGASIQYQYLWVFAISGIIMILLTLFFKYTIIGRSMRACSSNRMAAKLVGINVKNMITISFILSAAIGAVAGVVISPIAHSQYDCGTSLAIKGFSVAILGGLGNSAGAVVAGIIIGILETLSISILPNAYKDAVAIAILLLILFIKPSGLFGKKEVAALKEF